MIGYALYFIKCILLSKTNSEISRDKMIMWSKIRSFYWTLNNGYLKKQLFKVVCPEDDGRGSQLININYEFTPCALSNYRMRYIFQTPLSHSRMRYISQTTLSHSRMNCSLYNATLNDTVSMNNVVTFRQIVHPKFHIIEGSTVY